MFLIKWEGYPHSKNTWEPRAHIALTYSTLCLMNKAIAEWY